MELRKLEDMILNDDESQLLDFKMYDYDFSDEKKKIDFIKDVISMANTPRKPDEPGYIILGVEHILGAQIILSVFPSRRMMFSIKTSCNAN